MIELDRPGWSVTLGPQVDVRSISVSPDGRWVATGGHHGNEGVAEGVASLFVPE